MEKNNSKAKPPLVKEIHIINTL